MHSSIANSICKTVIVGEAAAQSFDSTAYCTQVRKFQREMGGIRLEAIVGRIAPFAQCSRLQLGP